MAIHEYEIGVSEEAPAQLDELGKTLAGAAECIRRQGWVQRSFGDDDGPRCVVGAIIQVALNRGYKSEHVNAASDRFRDSLDCGRSSMMWNDLVCKSKEQAIEALERAAWGL